MNLGFAISRVAAVLNVSPNTHLSAIFRHLLGFKPNKSNTWCSTPNSLSPPEKIAKPTGMYIIPVVKVSFF